MELPGCNTLCIPRCDVFFTVRFARSTGIIQRRAESCASTDFPCVLVTLPVLVVCAVLIAPDIAETCTLFIRKLPSFSLSEMSAWGTDEEIALIYGLGYPAGAHRSTKLPTSSVPSSSCSPNVGSLGFQSRFSLVSSYRRYFPESQSYKDGLWKVK